jgi:hypothetical protein
MVVVGYTGYIWISTILSNSSPWKIQPFFFKGTPSISIRAMASMASKAFDFPNGFLADMEISLASGEKEHRQRPAMENG